MTFLVLAAAGRMSPTASARLREAPASRPAARRSRARRPPSGRPSAPRPRCSGRARRRGLALLGRGARDREERHQDDGCGDRREDQREHLAAQRPESRHLNSLPWTGVMLHGSGDRPTLERPCQPVDGTGTRTWPRSRRRTLASTGRRLSFIVGVSSSPPGSQSPSTSVKRLIASGRESVALAASTASWTAATHALVAGERREVALDALARGPGGREVGVEHEQRRVVAAAVADHARLADQRRGALERRLDVRRRHVLARGVDDQLLLAVDQRDVAVLVDRGDVAGVQPAVVVERLGRALGQVAVADHHDLRAREQLAVVGAA